MKYPNWLKNLEPCTYALQWSSNYDTLATAVAACNQVDWLLWLLGRSGKDQFPILGIDIPDVKYRLLACRFVRETPIGDGKTVWDLLTDERARNAVIVAERHAAGEATDIELSDAANAAWDIVNTRKVTTRDVARFVDGVEAAVAAARAATWYGALRASDSAWEAAWVPKDTVDVAQCDIIRDHFRSEIEELSAKIEQM